MPKARPAAVPATLAVVDLGSNSFRLELGRVEGEQIMRLETWRDTLRLGAGIDAGGSLTPAAQRAAIEALSRFGERLRGLDPSAVRAVATNTFRVATNARKFLPRFEAALGFPIDIIGGHEEARLIYLGVAHVLPPSTQPRLVIDIGGGSTEFIIGRSLEPQKLESLKVGCVGMSQRFFERGALSAAAFTAAETHARAEIEAIASDFERRHWQEAYASSGTALALADLLEINGLTSGGITPEGLARLRKRMIGAGHLSRLKLEGLKPSRAPVLAGGLAIMRAALAELGVERINPVGGALRLGVLYDLLGRRVDRDSRVLTVEHFLERYRVDRPHAEQVAKLTTALYRQAVPAASDDAVQHLAWAALLHEIGFAVSHIGFHKHGAYILQNADMPGFSAGEQRHLAALVLGCRGSLDKVAGELGDPALRAQILSLRIAVLLLHGRRPVALPRIRIKAGRSVRLAVPQRWLASHPMTAHLLAKEREEWAALGFPLRA